MTIKKAKKLLTIDLLDNDPDELLLANYLKSNKNVKGQLLAAAKAHFRAIAVSEDPNNADEDVELAILESLQLLWGQMNYIVDYHRIKRKIHLTAQSLMRFGLGTTAFESIVNSPQPRTQPLSRMRVIHEPEGDEDKDEESSSNKSDDDIPENLSDDRDSFNLTF
jgi:DNA polymerase III psi subunit